MLIPLCSGKMAGISAKKFGNINIKFTIDKYSISPNASSETT